MKRIMTRSVWRWRSE